MAAIRKRRIFRRAFAALTFIVLMMLSYPCAWIVTPRLAEMTVNVEENEDRALATVHERWPNPVIPGELNAELPLPRHFEQAASVTEPADLRGKVLTGTNVDTYLSQISELSSAGYTHVFLHQVGTDQDAFFRFASERLLPAIRSSHAAA